MTDHFRYRLRVRYSECDAQQVVFNARYADYADLATVEYIRAIFGASTGLMELGFDYQVAKLTLNWQSSAHFDEVIEVRVRTKKIGTTSFVLTHEMVKADGGTPICQVEAVYVFMMLNPLQKTPVPDDIRTLFQVGARGVLIDHSGGIP